MLFKAILAVLLLFPLISSAQSIGRSTMGSFGGSSTNGTTTIQSTGGQGSSTETGVSGSTTLRQGFIQPVSFQEISDEIGVNLYPNPTNGVFSFETSLDQNDAYSFSLTDENGKSILSGDGQGNVLKEINLSNYPSGSYFLSIDSNKGNALSKIILIR
jgi:hypothetical protein